MLLTANGWQAFDDSIETVTLNDDDSITLHHGAEVLNEMITGQEIALSGLSVSLLLNETDGDESWAKAIPSELKFPENSVGYKLSFKSSGDFYAFSEWGDCDDQNKLGGLCNTVWHQKSSGNFEDDGPAVTLAELVVASPAVLDGTATDLATIKGIHVGWSDHGNLLAELVEGGEINFYKVNFSSQSVEKLTTGSWNDTTVHGVVLRKLMGPNYLSEFDGFFDNDKPLVMFEV